MNDIHVLTDTLRQSANGLQNTAEQIGPAAGHWLDNSFTAADTLAGWESGPALKSCADAWQAHMKYVVDQLHTYAEQLRNSAHSYDTAEEEATRRLGAALADLHSTEH
ncbi:MULTISPECIES: type VII secretion target [Kitasatospora]|uniref:WXG100 family type VII secretion target n=1 Tax=Kitasatospora cystarginea TaxID=58350 RepID=A0ABP5REZ8_9ACTN